MSPLNIAKRAILAGIVGLGVVATVSPTSAYSDMRCGGNGDRCARVALYRDCDRCSRSSMYRGYDRYSGHDHYRGYDHYRAHGHWRCNRFGDECRWVLDRPSDY